MINRENEFYRLPLIIYAISMNTDNLEDCSYLAHRVGPLVPTGTGWCFKIFNILLKPFLYRKTSSVPRDLARLTVYIVNRSTSTKYKKMAELF